MMFKHSADYAIANPPYELHWYALGMDFADALHLASSLQTEQFVTFDKRMVNKANAFNINQIVSLLERSSSTQP